MTAVFDRMLEEETSKQARKPQGAQRDGDRVDIERYAPDHGMPIVKIKPHKDGMLYCLDACAFDSNHTSNEAAIFQGPDGKLTYQCFHESCKGRTWKELRQAKSGDASLAPYMTGGNGNGSKPARQVLAQPRTQSNEADDERAAIRDEGRGIYDQQQPSTNPTDGTPEEKPRFEFIHNAEILADLHPTEWRIRDVLTDYALYYNFGDPGHFKTFIELDRLLCIASGSNYHGHKGKQGTVFYIAGEGQQGIGRRIAAWHIAHKTKAADVPFFVAKVPTQLMDPAALDDVKRAVDFMTKQYGLPAVVHFDTLARNFGEGDENATKDVNAAISNLDKAFGNDFCRGLTHHTGHANKDRARGAMALHGAADAAFRISLTESGQVLVECKKMKDAPSAPMMLFDRREIMLRIGDTDDRSYVLDLAAEGDDALRLVNPQKDVELKGGLQKALDILRRLYQRYQENLKAGGRSCATPSVSFVDWRTACMDAGVYKRTDNFRTAAEKILLHGLIRFDEAKKYVYLIEMVNENES